MGKLLTLKTVHALIMLGAFGALTYGWIRTPQTRGYRDLRPYGDRGRGGIPLDR